MLIYLLFGFIFYLFAHSAFISYIKGTGVALSETQFPEIYQQYKRCCEKLEIKTEPKIYIISADGALNALATKFLRRHYVVLYSDVVDSLSRHAESLGFYIGHELGHIKRGHLDWSFWLWPASLLPILGPSYSRAREYTCDLHGLACCENAKDAARGLAVLAAGSKYWAKMNINEYIGQAKQTGTFWMSLHELTSTYPWLCKRMTHIAVAGQQKPAKFPSRHKLAWIISLFIPGIRVGAAGGSLVSLMIIVAIIGILAAIAIPAYQDYTLRAKVATSNAISLKVKKAATAYILENRRLPDNLEAIGLAPTLSNDNVASVQVTETGFAIVFRGPSRLAGKTLLYEPIIETDGVRWVCTNGSLENEFRPVECRE